MVINTLGYYKNSILTGANNNNVKIVNPISALSKKLDYSEENLAIDQANASNSGKQNENSDNLIDGTNLNDGDVLNVFYLKRVDSKRDNSLKPKISGSNIAFLSEA